MVNLHFPGFLMIKRGCQTATYPLRKAKILNRSIQLWWGGKILVVVPLVNTHLPAWRLLA